MKFRYTTFTDPADSSRPACHRPMVDFKIFGSKDGLNLFGLLDSGADHTMVSSQVAKAIGVNLDGLEQRKIEGVGGMTSGKFAEADIEIKYLKRIRIPVLFVDDFPYILLGQAGIFDNHRIKFERDHLTFEVISTAKKQ
ncbi:MAG: retropepsin-like domain-containing protein [Candidatus Harrisonbacteria bacterium]|nr:retropepsin-like domain-containing protein [Candidatus Harrisonbacteria bacterium]MBI3114584.1 retropepsin-like domain-containing protein [Candidatus Harrisonbacteria bacterium]